MKIRTKVLMVVLPLLVFPLFLIGYTSYLSARRGITRIAEEFLRYKTTEMFKYCARQEDILVGAGLSTVEDYRKLARQSAEEYAETIRLSETGYFLAATSRGDIVFPKLETSSLAGTGFFEDMKAKKIGFIDFTFGGARRVGYYAYFEPWDWFILLSEREKTFFQDANSIKNQVALTLGVTFLCATGLILFFIKKLTDPVSHVVSTMKEIITTSDLGKRVRVEYDDEIGYLATWFNRMVEDLEVAYNQIKQYAYKSVLSQRNEERIRHIFQKYVPAEVIDEVLKAGADRLLIGKKQTATILFSDIRDFTTISEKLTAEQLVTSLNSYFNIMVGIIMEYEGMIDKFIGDAIMAIFGAPVLHNDDPAKACLTGFKMLESSKAFNRKQSIEGKPSFKMGVGLNTGEVVVGNIGSTQKLDYTCIGDAVNLASRLEGLTKQLGVPIIISEYTYREVKAQIAARDLGSVKTVGKAKPVKIYQPFADVPENVRRGYEMFNEGIMNYRNRDFKRASKLFTDSRAVIGRLDGKEDEPCNTYIKECDKLIKEPPGENWDGVYTALSK